MNWIDVCWIVMAAACLTLASVHLLIWNHQKRETAQLSFAIAGFAVMLTGVFELLAMHADSPQRYADLMRWAHLPLATLVVALVAFVRLHLGAGRAWLGHLAWGLRAVALVPNFTTGVNVNFLEVNQLLEIEAVGGAHFVTPVGIANPWMALVQLSNVLLVAFFIDAAIAAWRGTPSRERDRTIRICSSLGLFVGASMAWNTAIIVGGVQFPLAVLPAFTGVVLVMSYELGGDVVRAAQLARDLSTSEATLRRSEQRIEDAVVAAGFGLWEWDCVTQEVWLSPRASELLGVDKGGLLDRGKLRGNLDPASLLALEGAIDPMLENGGEFLSEFSVKDGNGPMRWLVSRGQCEFDGSGKPAIVRGVLVDITARKEAATQRDELIHLSRVALFAELSGSLAHELNQPLMSILSNAQAAQGILVQDPGNLQEVSDCLADIVESDKHAGEVIQRLRMMLRKQPSVFRDVQLNDLVRDVLRIIRVDLTAKGIDVQLQLQPDLPMSDGDVVQLQQVLLNLIVNASDAMQGQDRDRLLTVATRSSQDGGVEVSVADHGTGIAPADLEHIFSPFVTTKPAGMGLGLAVCTTIIQSHRGRLWATNNHHGGATVLFMLPPRGTLAQ